MRRQTFERRSRNYWCAVGMMQTDSRFEYVFRTESDNKPTAGPNLLGRGSGYAIFPPIEGALIKKSAARKRILSIAVECRPLSGVSVSIRVARSISVLQVSP